MCVEFQHLSCQVVVIKGPAYLLTYFIAVVIDSKLKDLINFGIYWKIFAFAFSALASTPLVLLTSLELGLDSVKVCRRVTYMPWPLKVLHFIHLYRYRFSYINCFVQGICLRKFL